MSGSPHTIDEHKYQALREAYDTDRGLILIYICDFR